MLTRRSFIAASALAGASTLTAGSIDALAQVRIDLATKDRQEEKYSSICRNNCQSHCRMYTVVRNGKVKITMAPFGPEAEKDLERLPSWAEPDEAYFGPTTRGKAFEDLRKKYPLHLFTEHTRWRMHSQFAHIPWLREQDPEPTIKINPVDAKRYGDIKDGDYVRGTNDRGTCVAKAILTEGLPEGIVNMPKGWHRGQYTQEYGYGGNYQELTNPVYPKVGMGMPFFDVRVKIEKAKKA